MTDAPNRTAGETQGRSLLATLIEIDADVAAGAAAMERLAASQTPPELALLASARLRFSRALRRHLQHIDDLVLPYLRAAPDGQGNDGVEAYRRVLNAYHEAAAHHVAQWPSTAVAADWNGYRRSVADMLTRLRARAAIERHDIHPLLAGRPSPPR